MNKSESKREWSPSEIIVVMISPPPHHFREREEEEEGEKEESEFLSSSFHPDQWMLQMDKYAKY